MAIAIAIVRPIPRRRLSIGAAGATIPKQSTGSVTSSPALAPSRCTPLRIWCSSGPTLVANGRRLAATSSSPTASIVVEAAITGSAGCGGLARVVGRAGSSLTAR